MNIPTFSNVTPANRKRMMAVGIVLLILLALIIFNPANRSANAQNTQRTNHISAILDAVHKYVEDDANSNNFPPGIPSVSGCGTPTADGNPPAGAVDVGTKGAHLATLLVPQYAESIPKDPSAGTNEETGYKICTNTATNAVTVWADLTERKDSDSESDLKVTR